jgi:hypothetical protein
MAAPHVSTNHGYDVKTTQPRLKNKGANAILLNRVAQTSLFLHVTDLETSLSLAGNTGQGVNTRDFYARNFQQPFFTISCQAPGQEALGYIGEFIHKAQRDSVRTGRVMNILVPAGGLKNTSRRMRGIRSAISMDGFVRSISRSHKRHDPVPEFQFDFVVSLMREGIFVDTPAKAYKLASWSDIVESIIQKNLIKAPHEDTSQDDSGDVLHPSPLAPGANGESRPT